MDVNNSGTEEKKNMLAMPGVDGKHDNNIDMHGPPPPELGSPLLPPTLARSISLGTGTIRGAVRTARSVGRVPFYAAQYTTAVSIELSRRVLDATLGQTGRSLCAQCVNMIRGPGEDVDTSRIEADQARIEAVVRSTSEAAQRGFNYLQVVTAAGFELTGNSVATMMDVSEVLLMLLNNTLGSTESSRALRSIIQFLSQEFQNPATGLPGERVGVRDLLWGVCGLVYLQNVCQRQDEQTRTKEALETVIWDVVVLDGQRVDVHESSLYGMHTGSYRQLRPQAMMDTRDETDDKAKNNVDGTEVAESLIRSRVLASLSSDATITVSTTTTKTVTVNITGNQPPPPILPPAGVELVELGPVRRSQDGPEGIPQDQGSETTYRIVFRINTDDREEVPRFSTPPSDLEDTTRRIEQVDDELSDTPISEPGSTSTGLFTPSKTPLTSPPEIDQNKPLPASPAALSSPNPTQRPRQPLQTLRSQPSTANQKKARQPPATGSAPPTQTRPFVLSPSNRPPAIPGRGSSNQATPAAAARAPTVGNDKKTSSGIRAAFKKPALGNLLHKDPPLSQHTKSMAIDPPASSTARKNTIGRTASPPTLIPPTKKTKTNNSNVGSSKTTDTAAAPKTQLVRTPLTSRALYRHETPSLRPPTPGRDGELSPFSSGNFHQYRGKNAIPDDLRSLASLASLASSLADNVSINTTHQDNLRPGAPASPKGHRSRANRGSIYTLHTNDSQGSLILSSYGPGRRAFMDGVGNYGAIGTGGQYNHGGAGQPQPSHTGKQGSATRPYDMLHEVQRTGRVPGMFPPAPLAYNLQRYMRFSSAAYGRDFLRAMSITSAALGPSNNNDHNANREESVQDLHHELVAYARHTSVAPADVLMASFIDANGGPDSSGLTRMPLVHYITLDHSSKAVVLACRGTLGFEDILADMACEYDDLYWRGRTYQVHKGVHAAARRILYGGDGRVLATLRDALVKYPDYGLVLCGHSLGGAVTSLLGVMLSEPLPANAASGGPMSSGLASFQTKSAPLRLLAGGVGGSSGGMGASREIPSLPPGRPVHVFAFGPPGTMTPALCKVTRGLITSLVHRNDLVPYLSLGVLHDLQAVALAFKTDKSHASAELWSRLWEKVRNSLTEKVFGKATAKAAGGRSPRSSGEIGGNNIEPEDAWAYAALKTLRASMLSPKLLPPGEVLAIDMQRVLQRTSYGAGIGSGRTDSMLMVLPAQRVVFKHVSDVEAHFREIKFSLGAFMDHSPGRYENVLDQLVAGL
ncbi:hypothetical protein SEUCBS139899_006563 [Sporothrix eucalyptigena]|uniref:sn-1-specific diacylglycerol lipase n=1 Tax=Sporothrix eucalyptigena TaxID=1812306 RepID=A0ABP0B877_9PEZI